MKPTPSPHLHGSAVRRARPFSLLMASAWQRLAGAAGLLAVLWGVVAWALQA